jgi:urease accessory protein UreF
VYTIGDMKTTNETDGEVFAKTLETISREKAEQAYDLLLTLLAAWPEKRLKDYDDSCSEDDTLYMAAYLAGFVRAAREMMARGPKEDTKQTR